MIWIDISAHLVVISSVYFAWGSDVFWGREHWQQVAANPQDYYFPWWFSRFHGSHGTKNPAHSQ